MTIRFRNQPTCSLPAANQLCENGCMATVLQFNRQLDSKPEISPLPGISVRQFHGEADILNWLELRHLAFARQRIGVRQWTAADFHSEFTSRWWWKPEYMWLAESVEHPELSGTATKSPQLVGAVTLAMRGEQFDADRARPVVHWLIIHPRWRRRGLGRLLMTHLETAAWNVGHREICLETHVAWEAAVKFYESLGYTAS
jgi:GNAT superfamily N-acetyltransferase